MKYHDYSVSVSVMRGDNPGGGYMGQNKEKILHKHKSGNASFNSYPS